MGHVVHRGGGRQTSELYAIDAASGSLIWSIDLDQSSTSPIAVSPDGVAVYVNGKDMSRKAQVIAINTRTGKMSWSTSLRGGDLQTSTAPALSPDGRTVLVGYDTLSAIDAASGNPLWLFDPSILIGGGDWSNFTFPQVIPKGTVFFKEGSSVYAIAVSSDSKSNDTECRYGEYMMQCDDPPNCPAGYADGFDAPLSQCILLPEYELDDSSPVKQFLAYGVLPLVLVIVTVFGVCTGLMCPTVETSENSA